MNRTIKDATVKRFYYETHSQLREHLSNFVAAYNFAKRLKTLQGLTPYEFICKTWTKEPQRFTSDPHHQIPGPNTAPVSSSRTAFADFLVRLHGGRIGWTATDLNIIRRLTRFDVRFKSRALRPAHPRENEGSGK